MDYAYAVKTLPRPDDPAPGAPAAPPPEPDPAPPQPDDVRPWAGDMYDEGDETDPAQAYAAFSGPHGEQAWLDKAEDGTLTGWVRDESGQVWRYSDPDTWAIDVDDAGMTQTSSGGQDAAAGGQQQVGAADDGAAITDEGGADPSLDFGTADEVVPTPQGDAVDGDTDSAGAAADGEDQEDPEEAKKNKKGGKKPWN